MRMGYAGITLFSACAVTLVFLILNTMVSMAGAATYRRTSISCYSCNSRNRTHISCHDPIHPENTSYVEHCKVPKEHHNGLFPAYYCVKMIGVSKASGEELVIRYCSLENMDNQCGEFKYMDEAFSGCILTCTYDGCNHAASCSRSTAWLTAASAALSFSFSILLLGRD